MTGSSYLFPGEATAKGLDALIAAHAMLPTHPRINVLLAKAYLQSGDRAKAERLLRLLVIQTESGAVQEAQKLLEGLPAESNAEATPASD
jgi:FimV-like protein